jgi:hypothetical protein
MAMGMSAATSRMPSNANVDCVLRIVVIVDMSGVVGVSAGPTERAHISSIFCTSCVSCSQDLDRLMDISARDNSMIAK